MTDGHNTRDEELNRKKYSKTEQGVTARILTERGEHNPSGKRAAAILAERLNNSRGGTYLD